jgi:6,7-dimethyl-8-ribityllumazine synthase
MTLKNLLIKFNMNKITPLSVLIAISDFYTTMAVTTNTSSWLTPCQNGTLALLEGSIAQLLMQTDATELKTSWLTITFSDDGDRKSWSQVASINVSKAIFASQSDHITLNCANSIGEVVLSINIIKVSGALEVPLALHLASQKRKPDIAIALGIVLKGDTAHYEHVCNEAMKGISSFAITHSTPTGNGILTVSNPQQILPRMSKGGEATTAAIRLFHAINAHK